MKLLVLQTMTQLSSHLAGQMHFLYSFTVVPWQPFVEEQKIIPYCASTFHELQDYPHQTHLNGHQFPSLWRDTLFGSWWPYWNMWTLSHSDWPPTGHSDLSVGEQPHSKKSHLHSVNQSPFGLPLVIFHPFGCMQKMTTIHKPPIPLWGMHSLSLAKKDHFWSPCLL